MRLLRLGALEIRPVQIAVNLYGEKSIKNSIDSILGEGYYPIPVLEINGEYFLCDGHHTSAGLFLLDRKINLRVLESDKEVRGYNKGVIRANQTLEEAMETIRRESEYATEMNILKVSDLLVRESSLEGLRKLSEVSLPRLIAA